MTALFLGRLGRGYDVRTFIRFNLLYPSLFAMIWIAIFSGTALSMDQMSDDNWLYGILQSHGPERVVFSIIEKLPFANIVSLIFLITAFLSYVTAADSNTSAMSGISSIGITPENPEAPAYIKIIWGALIGLVAWVMVTYAGIDGIKMASNLGGLPALVIVLFVALGLVKYVVKGID